MSHRAIKKIWRKRECVSLSEHSQSEKATYRDMLEETKPWDSEKLSGCSGLGGGKDGQVEHGGCLEQGNYPVWHCNGRHVTLYMSVQTHRTKHGPSCKLIRVTMCQCRFTDCNKWTIWCGCGQWGRGRRYTENPRSFTSILL